MAKAKKILLCLGGGGARGIATTIMIEHLEEKIAKFSNEIEKNESGKENHLPAIEQKVDNINVNVTLDKQTENSSSNNNVSFKKNIIDYIYAIGATSIGSFIGAALSVPSEENPKAPKYSASDVKDMLYHGADINLFQKKYFASGAFVPMYSNENIQNFTDDVFNSIKLDDKLITKLLIPSYSLDRNKITIWSNLHCNEDFDHPDKAISGDIHLRDAILSSAAAPVYFPAHSVNYKVENSDFAQHFEIDGGIYANYPSLLLITELLNQKEEPLNLEDVCLISIGTGRICSKPLDIKLTNGGYYNWIINNFKISYIAMDAAYEHDKFVTKTLLQHHGGKFYHLNPIFSPGFEPALDDSSHETLQKVTQETNDYLLTNSEYIDEIAKYIAENNYLAKQGELEQLNSNENMMPDYDMVFDNIEQSYI